MTFEVMEEWHLQFSPLSFQIERFGLDEGFERNKIYDSRVEVFIFLRQFGEEHWAQYMFYEKFSWVDYKYHLVMMNVN